MVNYLTAEEASHAGAFVGMDGAGNLRVERGYVRPQDELPIEPEAEAEHDAPRAAAARVEHDRATMMVEAESITEPDEDEGLNRHSIRSGNAAFQPTVEVV
jgi:ParB family chromosome partitioning protein